MAPLSKADKRIARKALKEDRRKAARRIIDPDPLITVRQAEPVAAGKEVRVAEDPASIKQRLMRWSDAKADKVGLWSWGVNRDWDDATWHGELHPKLCNFATMTWAEIEAHRVKSKKNKSRKAHHELPLTSVCQEAQVRAGVIKVPADMLFRFRLGGKKRLWGYRLADLFNVVWYDPTHQIYPTDPN